ncbi:MAG: hypothetical protein WC588_01710 [Candidatus Micrarchaeia archaeon]
MAGGTGIGGKLPLPLCPAQPKISIPKNRLSTANAKTRDMENLHSCYVRKGKKGGGKVE